MPVGAEWTAEQWLRKNGAADADIENIDFNPFTGRFALYNLRAGGGTDQRFHIGYAAVDLDYLPLFSKRVELPTVTLRDTAIDLDVATPAEVLIGALRIPLAGDASGTEPAPDTQTATSWHFGIQAIELANVHATIAHPLRQEDVRINRLFVQELQSWTPDQPVPVEVDVVANEAVVKVDVDTLPFAHEPRVQGRLRIDGLDLSAYQGVLAGADIANARGIIAFDYRLDGRLHRDGTIDIEAEGRLSAEGLHAEMPAMVFDQQSLTWQLRTEARVTTGQNAAVLVENHGQIDVANINIVTPDVQLAQQQVSWRGKSFTKMPPPAGELMVNIQGELHLTGTTAALPDLAMNIVQDRISWTGDIQYGAEHTDAETLPLAMNAQLAAEGLHIHDTHADITLASLATLMVERLRLDGLSEVHAGRVTLSQLRALWDGTVTDAGIAQLLAIDDITIANAAYREHGAVEIGNIAVSALQMALLGNDRSDFKWLSPLLADSSTAAPADSPGEEGVQPDAPATAVGSDAATAPLAIKLGLIKFTGDSWIVFEDEAVAPAFRTRLEPVELTVTGIDSARPDNPAEVHLTATIDQYTELDIAGTVNIFHDSVSADLKGKLAGLDLPPLSSYSAQYIGYDLKRGRLDVDIDVNIDHGKIDSKNMVYLNKLNIVQKDEETAKKFSDQLAMPLDAALGMLRDKQGNIKFALPVEGDITEPQFKLSGVINLALAKALKTAAMRYVTNALQPLGTVLFVGKVAGKAMQMKFEPVQFETGQGELTANAAAYLDKIGTLLQERPALSVTLCGIANLDDRVLLTQRLTAPAQTEQALQSTQQAAQQPQLAASTPPAVDPEVLREALLSLAAQRSSIVKDYLVEDKGIAQERLFSCRPTFDDREKALPGVEMTL